ncbi:MAG: YndJ family protein [Pyrinomonadaceae bacterium]
MNRYLRLEPGWGRSSALVGGAIWLLLFSLQMGDSPETELIQRIVLLGILVIVPLGLSLVPGADPQARKIWLYRLALVAQPLGAIAAVASFLLQPGLPAAALACLWFFVTGVMALLGLWRLGRHELRSAAEISISAGLLYVPVAGFWLVVSRLGIQLLGYGDTIILLTAVHFHFAAYAAPILAGLAGRQLSKKRNLIRIFKFTPIGIIAGTPLVAAGITLSPMVALVGTVMITVGLLLLALLTLIWILPSIPSLVSRLLLLISSLSTLPAMLLACAYAYSIVFQKLIIDIPQMAKTHGIANAFGFALCGLVGWALIVERSEPLEIKSHLN